MSGLSKTILSIAVAGLTLWGGITLFQVDIGALFPYYEAPPVSISPEDHIKNQDTQLLQNATQAMKDKDYKTAIGCLRGISVDYVKAQNVQDLYLQSVQGYIDMGIKESNELLEDNRFDEALETIRAAIGFFNTIEKEAFDISTLEKQQSYIEIRRTIYGYGQGEQYREAISFVMSHQELLGTDKRVIDILSELKNKYIQQVIHAANTSLSNKNLNEAEAVISEAMSLIGETDELSNKRKEINEKKIQKQQDEVDIMITALEKAKKWPEIMEHINAIVDPLLKEHFENRLSSARNNYRGEVVSQSRELIKKHDYASAKQILTDAAQYVSGQEEFDSLYNRYKDYDAHDFSFKPVVSSDSRVYNDAACDINNRQFNNAFLIDIYSNDLSNCEVRLDGNYTSLTGVFFLNFSGSYDREDAGDVTITFYGENKRLLATYSGVSYKNNVPFQIPLANDSFITIQVKNRYHSSVTLGIGEGVLQ